jgi:hypothetical protein
MPDPLQGLLQRPHGEVAPPQQELLQLLLPPCCSPCKKPPSREIAPGSTTPGPPRNHSGGPGPRRCPGGCSNPGQSQMAPCGSIFSG